MKRLALAIAFLVSGIAAALAQTNVQVIGPIVPGNLPQFSSPTIIKDSGLPASALPTGLANPSGAVGLTAVPGSASTAMRSDAAAPLSASVQSALTGTNNLPAFGTGAFGYTTRALVGSDLPANGVANSNLAQMPANTVKCNPTGSTANVQDCVTVILPGTGGGPNSAFLASAASPAYGWQATGQAVDQKVWDINLQGTNLQFRAVNDSNSAAFNWMTVTRGAGATVSGVTIPSANTGPTADGAVLTVQNGAKTASQIYSPLVPAGFFFYGVTRSVLDLESGTTVQQGSAFDAYVFVNVAQGTAPNSKNGVGLFVDDVVAINGGAAWGLNTSCGDNSVNGLATLSGRKCIGYELDFTANGASTFEGISEILQGPGTPVGANALQISIVTGSTAQWTNGLVINDGAILSSGFGAIFGAMATSGTNVQSAPVEFAVFNSAGTEHGLLVRGIPFGTQTALSILDSTLANGIIITNNATGAGPQINAQGSDANINLDLNAKGAASIRLESAVTWANFTANGAVATALSSVGPTGAHTTVQEWLTVFDQGGTVRYVPAF